MSQTTTKQDNFAKARAGILKFIGNVFKAVKLIFDIIFNLIRKSIDLIHFVFSGFLQLISNPSIPSTLGIVVFVGVAIVAGVQWWQIGQWLFAFFGLTPSVAGSLGLLIGGAINIFQLAPKFWKLSRHHAKAYKKLNINPDDELPKMTLENRLDKWLSYDHQTLKKGRALTYLIEGGLVLTHLFATGLTPIGFLKAVVSLVCPELVLEVISATTELANEVTEEIQKQEDDELDKYRKSIGL